MCGEREQQAGAAGDDAWLRQYYTQGKATPAPFEPTPSLTQQPAGKYGEAQQLGAGGEKDVVQVRDRDTLRDVALARPRNGRSPQAFVREARLLARLEHPHIVPVHDLGLEPDGRPYFTMKLLAGETLDAVLPRLRQGDVDTRTAYPLPVLLDIFTRVCEAVAFAHSRGIIHRDIKPANVQIGNYGEVRLIDWGLAKSLGDPSDPSDPSDPTEPSDLTDAAATFGVVNGTPGYMAPEQAAGRGASADVRTDTYALGALLYATLAWHPPVAGDTTTDVLCKTIAGEIVPLRRRAPGRVIPRALEAIACKALATRPENRYQTADALLADLHAYTAGCATSAEEAGPLRLLWLLVKRHRTLALVMCGSLLALTVLGLVAEVKIHSALASLQVERDARRQLVRPAIPKLLEKARAQIHALVPDDALETLQIVIGADPDQTEAWDLAGWIDLGQERFEAAAFAFRRKLQTFVEKTATAINRRKTAANDATGWRAKRNATCNALGLTLAERGRKWMGDHDGRPLPPEEFRQLIEQVCAAGTRQVCDNCRTTLGVYCSRHNPEEWTNAAYCVFLQRALHALNDGRAELELRPTAAGLEARVTGSAANDLLLLAGLPLVLLDVHGTAVRDLQPLRGMPLRTLDISSTPVAAFEPIYGLRLRELDAEGFRKITADLFARCPTIETVKISADAELSRQGATWPTGVKVIRGH